MQAAIEHVVHSGQQLILDRLDLMQLELKDAARDAVQRMLGLAVAALLGLAAFVTLTVAIVLFLSQVMSTAAAALLVSAVYGAVSVGAVLWARHRHAGLDRAASSASSLNLRSSTT